MRHQVFELPKVQPIVTEYVRLRGVCSGCGQKHHGALPVGAPNGQLGPRALALVGTLAGQFHLTQRKVQDVLSHVMGIRLSLGTVSQAHGLVSQALAAPVAQLHAELQYAPVCHADETRHQSHGHTMWMWVLASDWGVRFRIDPSRALLAAKLLLGERPSFVTVSDRYAATTTCRSSSARSAGRTCCATSSASQGAPGWAGAWAGDCWATGACCFAGAQRTSQHNTLLGCKSAFGFSWNWAAHRRSAAARPIPART